MATDNSQLIEQRLPDNDAGQIFPEDVRLVAHALDGQVPNQRRGGPFLVSYLTQAAALAAGQPLDGSLEQLDPALLCLGAVATVQHHPDGSGVTLVLVFDGTGQGLPVAVNGNFQRQVAGKWVRQDSQEAASANVPYYDPQYNAPAGYPVAYLVRYRVPGQTEAFYYAEQAGQLAAPTGADADPNWRVVPGPVPAVALAQALPLYAAHYLLLGGGNVTPGRLYAIGWPADAQGRAQTIYVRGLSRAAFDVIGTLEVGGSLSQVTVDVAAGTYTTVATNAVPLTGTEDGKPVTGDVEFLAGKGLRLPLNDADKAGEYSRLCADNGLHVASYDADDNLLGQTYIYKGQYVISGAVPLIGFAQYGNAAYGVLSLENGRFKLNLPLDAPNLYTKDETDARFATPQQLAALVGAAPAALDTLAEIASQLQQDEQGVGAILATQQQHTQQIQQNTSWIGTLGNLLSTAKGNLVAAFNELWQKAALLAANQTFTGTNTFVLPVVGDTYQGTGGQHSLSFSRAGFHEGPTFKWAGVDRVQLNFVGGSSGRPLAFVYETRNQYLLHSGNANSGEFYFSNPNQSNGSYYTNDRMVFFASGLAATLIRNGARLGIGTDAPSEAVEVANGNLKISQAGKGLIFPDGTVQTTAATATGGGGGGSGPAYTAGEGIDITGGIISTTGNPLALKSYNRALLSYIQNVGGGATVNFDVIQDGTHISGGVFTAPADGLYTVQTSLVMTGTSAGAACNVGVYVNGQERAKVGQLLMPGGNYAFPDSSRTLKLHAGDQVSVVAATDSGQVFGSTQYQVTTFTVFQTA